MKDAYHRHSRKRLLQHSGNSRDTAKPYWPREVSSCLMPVTFVPKQVQWSRSVTYPWFPIPGWRTNWLTRMSWILWPNFTLRRCREKSFWNDYRKDEHNSPHSSKHKIPTDQHKQLAQVTRDKTFPSPTMPSMPWGRSITKPVCRIHLDCPEAMNWSMMHWAVLWKSPNWASQMTRALGLVIEKPSSKPSTAYSEREELQTV